MLKEVPGSIFRVTSYEQMIKMLYFRAVFDVAVLSEPAFYHPIKQAGLSEQDFGATFSIEV